jgi:hypothetical protein
MVYVFGTTDYALRLSVKGPGSESRVSGIRFRVQGLGIRHHGLGFGVLVSYLLGLGFRV